jgi:hypothetical protein
MDNKQQLYNNLNDIINYYNTTGNVERFYKKLSKINIFLSQYISKNIYEDYKYDLKNVYNDMINGEDYSMIVNDCINSIRKIMLELLVFE